MFFIGTYVSWIIIVIQKVIVNHHYPIMRVKILSFKRFKGMNQCHWMNKCLWTAILHELYQICKYHHVQQHLIKVLEMILRHHCLHFFLRRRSSQKRSSILSLQSKPMLDNPRWKQKFSCK